EIVVYDGTIDDLTEKINYYLRHDNERNRIARNAYQKAISSHTYLHRVKFILEKIEQSKNLIICYCNLKNTKLSKFKLKFSELILYLRNVLDVIISRIKELKHMQLRLH
ncbi:MAG: glycosyltransferase, partial [Candidatus Kryptonium sp.]